MDDLRLPPVHIDLLRRLLSKHPATRMRAEDALRHTLLADHHHLTHNQKGFLSSVPRTMTHLDNDYESPELGKQRMSCVIRESFFELPVGEPKRTSILCLREAAIGSPQTPPLAPWQTQTENSQPLTQRPRPEVHNQNLQRHFSFCEVKDSVFPAQGEARQQGSQLLAQPGLKPLIQRPTLVQLPVADPQATHNFANTRPERRIAFHRRITLEGSTNPLLKIY